MSTGDAVAREAAWLQSSGDTLPALLKPQGGPFDVVQAYWTRTPDVNARSLYVLRRRLGVPRTANQRIMPQHPFQLVVWWPVLDGTGSDEAEQQALDNAVDLTVTRINGLLLPVMDKTHGGRFLSVAENPRLVDVEFTSPEVTLPQGYLRADITYSADDLELNM